MVRLLVKGQPVYIGNPEQQQQTADLLETEFTSNRRGIFIIVGPNMVGKDKLVKDVVTELGLDAKKEKGIWPHQIGHDDYKTYGVDEEFEEAKKNGETTFVLGEIPLAFDDTLKWLKDFYNDACRQGKDIRIIFNTVCRDFPAWENDNIRTALEKLAKNIFGDGDDLHLYYLSSDPRRIVDELWRTKQDEPGQLDMLRQIIGFGEGELETIWYLDLICLNDERAFKQRLREIVEPPIYTGPETKS